MGRRGREGQASLGGVTVKVHWLGLGLSLPFPLGQGYGLTLKSLMALKVNKKKAKCGCRVLTRLRVYMQMGEQGESLTIQIQGFPELQHGMLICFHYCSHFS